MNEKFDKFTVIVRNSAKCNKCGDEIESKHRHDYVECSCGAIAVDGGKDYIRRSACDFSAYQDTSDSRYYTLEETEEELQRALTLSKSEFGSYYRERLMLLRQYKNFLLYGDEGETEFA